MSETAITWAEWDAMHTALYLQPHHQCGGKHDPPWYLDPPHHGTDGEVLIDDGRRMKIYPASGWILCLGIDNAKVDYCPWCGEKLPT